MVVSHQLGFLVGQLEHGAIIRMQKKKKNPTVEERRGSTKAPFFFPLAAHSWCIESKPTATTMQAGPFFETVVGAQSVIYPVAD